MIDRRALSLMLFGSAAGLAGCASQDGPERHARRDAAPEEQSEMLFISPMGEPFRAYPPAPYPVAAWFHGADKNADGELDLPEFLADAERFFHVLDLTKDGIIDHREIFYYEHKLVPEVLNPALGALVGRGAPRLWLAQYGGSPGGAGGPGGGSISGDGQAVQEGSRLNDKPFVGAAAYGLLADPEPVQGADIRLTGAITLSDFKTRAEQRFRLLDDKERGYLTLDTLPETQAEALLPQKDRRRGGGRRA